MVQRFVQLIALGICVVALTAAARADLVTFEVTGEVVFYQDRTGVGWTVPVGAPFGGRFTFDSETPDGLPDWSDDGQYNDAVLMSAFSIASDAMVDTGVAGRITVADDIEGQDSYSVHDTSITFRGYSALLNLIFVDDDHTVFSSDALPLIPPALDQFEDAHWSMGTENDDFVIIGSISSLTLVPEPSSLTLLAVGMALSRTRRRLIRAFAIQA